MRGADGEPIQLEMDSAVAGSSVGSGGKRYFSSKK